MIVTKSHAPKLYKGVTGDRGKDRTKEQRVQGSECRGQRVNGNINTEF